MLREDLEEGEPGFEVCDDGNTSDGDCCNATCTAGTGAGACCDFDTGEKKLIFVNELNQCLAALGAQYSNVQYIEVAYGHLDYLDNICQEFGYSSYASTHGGDQCTGSAYMYPSHCGQGWLGTSCWNGCGNANYDGFYCN